MYTCLFGKNLQLYLTVLHPILLYFYFGTIQEPNSFTVVRLRPNSDSEQYTSLADRLTPCKIDVGQHDDAQNSDSQYNDVQNDELQQDYAQNDVSYAQPDGIQVQESLSKSTRVFNHFKKIVIM